MQEVKQQSKKPYVFYVIMGAFGLVVLGLVLMAIIVYLSYFIIDLLISTVAPYAYFKEYLKHKENITIHSNSNINN
jgi:hypothetical protein